MCKIFRWMGYASTIVGVILIILAGVSGMCHQSCPVTMDSGGCHANLFNAANSFLLLAIALFMITKHCCCKKCCEVKEDTKAYH